MLKPYSTIQSTLVNINTIIREHKFVYINQEITKESYHQQRIMIQRSIKEKKAQNQNQGTKQRALKKCSKRSFQINNIWKDNDQQFKYLIKIFYQNLYLNKKLENFLKALQKNIKYLSFHQLQNNLS
ncbi:hypothetical protein pb186bvf_001819 [Paramecium bursaria]